MQINSISTTNFGMKYSDKFNNVLNDYPHKAGFDFSRELKKAKEEMASALPDSYTMDIQTKKDTNLIILKHNKKAPQLLAFFYNGTVLDHKFLSSLKYSLSQSKKMEKYFENIDK